MKWNNFIQISLFFLLFLLSISIFKFLELDVNFIITFIMAIFTLTISIFFFTESSKLMTTINEKVTEMRGDLRNMSNPRVTEGLNILRDYNVNRLRDGSRRRKKSG